MPHPAPLFLAAVCLTARTGYAVLLHVKQGVSEVSGEQRAKGQSIPLIIHVAWVPPPSAPAGPMPPDYETNLQKWKSLHPTWQVMLWNETACRDLVRTHYHWFLSTYDGFDKNIKRLDSMRYIFLHKFGGVYTDLDITPGNSIAPFLQGYDTVLFNRGGAIQNSFFASTPGDDFFLDALRKIKAIASLPFTKTDIYEDVLCAVGWAMLTPVWTKRGGQLDGSGSTANGRYMVYSEDKFRRELGLHHHFSAKWVGQFSERRENCDAAYGGWSNTMRA